jgi:hypothetical protein
MDWLYTPCMHRPTFLSEQHIHRDILYSTKTLLINIFPDEYFHHSFHHSFHHFFHHLFQFTCHFAVIFISNFHHCVRVLSIPNEYSYVTCSAC